MDLSKIEHQLLTKPLTLLGPYKIEYICEIIEKNQIKNFLEIGTWLGGSTYILSKRFPKISFTTIDINDFDIMYEENPDLSLHVQAMLKQDVDANLLQELQHFYRTHSPNVTFCDVDKFDWNECVYDAILVDGDHSTEGLTSDLVKSFKNIKHKGFIFVDDISYLNIRYCTLKFFKRRRQKIKLRSIEAGSDLAIVKVDKNGFKI